MNEIQREQERIATNLELCEKTNRRRRRKMLTQRNTKGSSLAPISLVRDRLSFLAREQLVEPLAEHGKSRRIRAIGDRPAPRPRRLAHAVVVAHRHRHYADGDIVFRA
jgi:hypothetical protein